MAVDEVEVLQGVSHVLASGDFQKNRSGDCDIKHNLRRTAATSLQQKKRLDCMRNSRALMQERALAF